MRSSQQHPSACALATAILAAAVAAPVLAGGPPAPFTEEAAARGLVHTVTQGNTDLGYGAGVAFLDLDGDGDDDIVATGAASNRPGIFENDGTGHFIDRSLESGLGLLSWNLGVVGADYDSDGDIDLYFSRWKQPNVLARNDGGFRFTDVSVEAGVDDGGSGAGCSWGDYDGDGRIDLYVSNRTGSALPEYTFVPNRLYRNLGNGAFVDVAPLLGVDDDKFTFQSLFFDYDRDGDADLYISTDKGYAPDASNRLWRNIGGAFVEVTEESGTAANFDSMGVDAGDFDGNGLPDLYCTNIPQGNALFMQQVDHTFLDLTIESGTASYATGWGAIFFDWDNDGLQDLYVCNDLSPNRLYHGSRTWPCIDVAAAVGVAGPATHRSFGCASGDVDGDGDIDLVVQSYNQPLRLYINREGERRHWVQLDVQGDFANTGAIGAITVVRTGELVQTSEVMAGSGYKGQLSLVRHFGLADAGVVDEISITWPGGAPARTLLGYPAGRRWTAVHPDRLGDADEDGDRDLDDFIRLMECLEIPFEPGCEFFDFDGDGDVDTDDGGAFLSLFDSPMLDCNHNGIRDLVDILTGTSADDNHNGIPDECEPPIGDIDGDGVVGVSDLVLLIGAWGDSGGPADIDGSGLVDVGDLVILIGNWTV